MGLKDQFQTYLDGLADIDVLPITQDTTPIESPGLPADLTLVIDDVLQLLREGKSDFDIARSIVDINGKMLKIEHVAIAREIWLAEVAERTNI